MVWEAFKKKTIESLNAVKSLQPYLRASRKPQNLFLFSLNSMYQIIYKLLLHCTPVLNCTHVLLNSFTEQMEHLVCSTSRTFFVVLPGRFFGQIVSPSEISLPLQIKGHWENTSNMDCFAFFCIVF